MHNGRFFRISLELFFTSLICLAASLLMPFSAWRALGETGASLTILAAAALIACVTVLRHRPDLGRKVLRPASAKQAG